MVGCFMKHIPNKIIILLLIICCIPFVNAENIEPADPLTAEYMTKGSLTSFSDMVIDSYYYNKTSKTLTFEITNSGNPKWVSVYDGYKYKYTRGASGFSEVRIDTGTHKYNFTNPYTSYGYINYIFLYDNKFCQIEDVLQSGNLPDELLYATKGAISKMGWERAILSILLFVSVMFHVKNKYIEKNLLIKFKQSILPITRLNIGLALLFLLYKYGIPFEATVWKDFIVYNSKSLTIPWLKISWHISYIWSYYNFYLFLIPYIASWVAYYVHTKKLLTYIRIDFKNKTVYDISVPYEQDGEKKRVLWHDKTYKHIEYDEVDEWNFVSTLKDYKGKCKIITDYQVIDYLEDTEQALKNSKSIGETVYNLFRWVKTLFMGKVGKVTGEIWINKSCIMDKTTAECVFLSDNLGKITESVKKWAGMYYEKAGLMGVEAQELMALAMEQVLRDVYPLAMRNIKDLLKKTEEQNKSMDVKIDDESRDGPGNEETNQSDSGSGESNT